jgi:hypothetical protein
MRWKAVLCVGMVVLATAGAAFLVLSTPAEPPLRVGMDGKEVDRLLNGPGVSAQIVKGHCWYDQPKDWLGNSQKIDIFFDDNDRVSAWKVTRHEGGRPHWLAKVMKNIRW